MNTVQPITSRELIDEMKWYLRNQTEPGERNCFMFVFGINSGLRIGDILPFRVLDVRGKHEVPIREGKTGKEKLIPLNATLRKAIEEYTKDMEPTDYLFPSRERDKNGLQKPITREMAYKILRDAADQFKMERIGCHSMRKTFGFHFYEKTKDLALLMYIFNHSSERITLRYIGKFQESYSKAMVGFGL